MTSVTSVACALWACVAVSGGLVAQEPDQPRRLAAAETGCDWTTAVVPELRRARFEPARKDGRLVRQVVYQVFIYHSDGRSDISQ